MRIKIDIEQIANVAQNFDTKLMITEFLLKKKTAKISPDHLSKIISKFLLVHKI